MPENINWAVAVQVTDGPAIKVGDNLPIDAYSKVKIELDDGATDQKVILGAADSEIVLLFVRANQYGDSAAAATALLYRMNTQAVDKNEIFELPIFLLGKSAVSLLSGNLQSMTFTNNTGSAVTLDILVGLDVTPAP